MCRRILFGDFQGAIRLLDYAFESVIQNFWAALRVSLGPLLVFLLLCFALFQDQAPALLSGGTLKVDAVRFAILFLGGGFLFFWSAVSWHRVVLPVLNDRKLPVLETIVYALKAFLFLVVILLILLVVGFIPLLALGGGKISVGNFALGYAQGWGHFVATFVLTWIFWLSYIAISPSLVHSALGGREGIFNSLWRSENKGGLLRSTALVITVCLLGDWLIGLGLSGFPIWVQVPMQLIVFWVVFMVSISILTQFYALGERTGTPRK